MATSVQVLCPNGRRQNVKVTPNTKLLQILEEVCTKQAFHLPDDYELIHGRKALDLTLAFRFSNLPNNAKLELVKSAVPRSQALGSVTIALQLENGERLQHTFEPSTTLWQILEYWESGNEKYKGQLTIVDGSQSPALHPVCIYMREEVVGELALRDTTLKKLALTSGKAIIRLVHRAVEDAKLSEIMAKLEQEKLKQAKLAQRAQQAESSASSQSVPSSSVQSSSGVDCSSSTVMAEKSASAEEQMEVDDSAKQETASGNSAMKMVVTETEPMDTLASETRKQQEESAPSAGACGSDVDKPSNRVDSSAVEELRRMNIPGVEIITPSDFDDLPPEQQQVARMLAERLFPGVMGSQQQASPRPKKPKTTAPQRPFADFKFPEETKGKQLYHNELSEVKHEEFKPCDREAVIYNSNEENTSKTFAEEPTDDFFEVTDSDVRSLYKDLQRHVSSERALMTEAMRHAELEQRHQQYQHVITRVQFPDGLVLQGCFRPRETIYALHKFVKEHLEDKGQEFYLYRTPPKEVFTDMTKTLVQADLAPASLVYFGSNKTEEHSLTGSARMEIAPKRRAEELAVKKLAKKQMETLASGGTDTGPPSTSSTTSSSSSSSGVVGVARARDTGSGTPSTPSTGASEGGKVPKWLKLGKK